MFAKKFVDVINYRFDLRIGTLFFHFFFYVKIFISFCLFDFEGFVMFWWSMAWLLSFWTTICHWHFIDIVVIFIQIVTIELRKIILQFLLWLYWTGIAFWLDICLLVVTLIWLTQIFEIFAFSLLAYLFLLFEISEHLFRLFVTRSLAHWLRRLVTFITWCHHVLVLLKAAEAALVLLCCVLVDLFFWDGKF